MSIMKDGKKKTKGEKLEKSLRQVESIQRLTNGVLETRWVMIVSLSAMVSSIALWGLFPDSPLALLYTTVAFLASLLLLISQYKNERLKILSFNAVDEVSNIVSEASSEIHDHRLNNTNANTNDIFQLQLDKSYRDSKELNIFITSHMMYGHRSSSNLDLDLILLNSRFALAVYQFAEENIPFDFKNMDLESTRAEEGIFVASSFCYAFRQADEEGDPLKKKQSIVSLMENHMGSAASMMSSSSISRYEPIREDIAHTIITLAEGIQKGEEEHGEDIPFFALALFAVSDDETGWLKVFEEEDIEEDGEVHHEA